jgi:hypothetical protein
MTTESMYQLPTCERETFQKFGRETLMSVCPLSSFLSPRRTILVIDTEHVCFPRQMLRKVDAAYQTSYPPYYCTVFELFIPSRVYRL